MSITTEISNTQDIIDSRDIIARIEDLEADDDIDREDADELSALCELAKEGELYASAWPYGATLIHEDYFTTYAQELAEDIGSYNPGRSESWPYNHIDWEAAADELKADYSEIEFDGETYFVL